MQSVPGYNAYTGLLPWFNKSCSWEHQTHENCWRNNGSWTAVVPDVSHSKKRIRVKDRRTIAYHWSAGRSSVVSRETPPAAKSKEVRKLFSRGQPRPAEPSWSPFHQARLLFSTWCEEQAPLPCPSSLCVQATVLLFHVNYTVISCIHDPVPAAYGLSAL